MIGPSLYIYPRARRRFLPKETRFKEGWVGGEGGSGDKPFFFFFLFFFPSMMERQKKREEITETL